MKKKRILSGHLIFWPFFIGGLLCNIIGLIAGVPLFLFGFSVMYYNEWARRRGTITPHPVTEN